MTISMNKLGNHFPHPPCFLHQKSQWKEKTIKPITEGAHVHSDTKGQPKLK